MLVPSPLAVPLAAAYVRLPLSIEAHRGAHGRVIGHRGDELVSPKRTSECVRSVELSASEECIETLGGATTRSLRPVLLGALFVSMSLSVPASVPASVPVSVPASVPVSVPVSVSLTITRLVLSLTVPLTLPLSGVCAVCAPLRLDPFVRSILLLTRHPPPKQPTWTS